MPLPQPSEPARGNVGDWETPTETGVDRFLACVAYLDGIHPHSGKPRLLCTRGNGCLRPSKDGKLTKRWSRLDTSDGNGIFGEGFSQYVRCRCGQRWHDEIIFGSACVDHDGSMYYRNGIRTWRCPAREQDARHLHRLLRVVCSRGDHKSLWIQSSRNLRTGKVIFGAATSSDNGRGMAADLSADNPGFEMWSTASGRQGFDINGKELSNVSIPKGGERLHHQLPPMLEWRPARRDAGSESGNHLSPGNLSLPSCHNVWLRQFSPDKRQQI